MFEGLARYQPTLIDPGNGRQASVAAILRESSGGQELLFIERATSPSDPWSGQIAFPGGGLEATDTDLEAAAIRETREEIGIVLGREDRLGRLDDQAGSNRNRRLDLVIACFVYRLEGEPVFEPNYEVADAFWCSLEKLKDPANTFDYLTTYRTEPFPAVRLDDRRVLWGLTWRFVQQLLERTG